MRILDISAWNSLPIDVPDQYVVPYNDIRYPSKYKRLASYTLNWHTRLVMESTVRPTMFVTLTFNDEHYIENRLIDNDVKKTLKVTWQKFIKRLRSNLDYYELPIKNFACYVISERGDDGRLHYHALFFGFPFQTFRSRNKKGQVVEYVKFNRYTEIIDKSWNMGYTVYEGACPENIKYVTKYLHKRMISPDYISLKTRGLGLSYLTESRKKFLHDNKHTKIKIGQKVYYLPRYIKQKIYDENELREVNAQIALEVRDKITSAVPADFIQNRHYVYYHNTLQFFNEFKDGMPPYAQYNDALKNIPFEQILQSVDESILDYDEMSDSFLAIPVDDFLSWYYLRRRYLEDIKYNSVFSKRL